MILKEAVTIKYTKSLAHGKTDKLRLLLVTGSYNFRLLPNKCKEFVVVFNNGVYIHLKKHERLY